MITRFKIPFLLTLANLIYLIIIGIMCKDIESNILGIKTNIAITLTIMFILESISTLTFQLRIGLTASYNNLPRKSLRFWIPFIASMSWIVAGFQGILLIGDTDNFVKFILKIVPVFIATFNGIYITLKMKEVN